MRGDYVKTALKILNIYKHHGVESIIRISKKIEDLKLGIHEQLQLWRRNVPAKANIMFDFESTTQESLNPDVTIRNCRKKISYMHNGDKILRIIDKLIKDL